jgi:DNA-binding response OmpR family regulator
MVCQLQVATVSKDREPKMKRTHRILLVEDDGAQRLTLCDIMSDGGDYHVVGVENLYEAEQAFRLGTTVFDAVLLDAMLPDGDGRMFCARLRQVGYAAPIIMLSGASTEADMRCGMEAGASAYIEKPVRMQVLMTCLQRHLSAVASHSGPGINRSVV